MYCFGNNIVKVVRKLSKNIKQMLNMPMQRHTNISWVCSEEKNPILSISITSN